MKTYIIERETPRVGDLKGQDLCELAKTSNEALSQLAPHVEWIESYLANDKTFCVYRAEDESFIRRHAELSGIPANTITEVRQKISPSTATGF